MLIKQPQYKGPAPFQRKRSEDGFLKTLKPVPKKMLLMAWFHRRF